MRKLIDKFCYRHRSFGIPNLMKYVAIANAVFWVAGLMSGSFVSYLQFDPYLILKGQVWRLISFAFIPPSSGWLGLIAVYFYYMIGNTLEARWGTARFSLYYFTGIVLCVLFGFVLYFVSGLRLGITATYIYLSMFFSFAALFPDVTVLLFFVIPIKIKWLAIIDAVLFVLSVIENPWPINMLPVVAILNFLLFCGDDLLSMLNIRKQTPSQINFKKASREIKREQAKNLYNHKCSVCGRTDSEYPNLQFRYCSRCQGYHCFCEDHINNHVHFTE